MCPDEEVIQSEVAEANKKLVKKASVDEGSGAEDEDSLLPESLQKQNDVKNSWKRISVTKWIIENKLKILNSTYLFITDCET